jgi:hypothetical protein
MPTETLNDPLTIISSGPSLLDLATELLVIIIDLLDDEDLLRISILSSRLHILALELYLSRQRGSYRSNTLHLVGPPFRMLSALRMALFVQDFLYLDMMFVDNPDVHSMKGLERLLRRISSVREFVFEGTFDMTWAHSERPGIREAMGGIFAALVGKGCVKLTIKGAKFNEGTSISDLTSERTRLTNIVSSPSPHDIPPLTTLTELQIYRSAFSFPTLRTWVVNAMNMSPITKLILDHVTFFDRPASMHEIFRLLTLPLLSHLSISSIGLNFSDVIEFLCRHPHIENMSLATDTGILSDFPVPAEALPLLSTLKVPPHCIRPLLAASGSVPTLKVIAIDPDFPVMFCNQQAAIDKRLEDIQECFVHFASREGVTTLRLALPADSWARNWLQQGSRPKDGKRRDVEQSLVHITTLQVDVWGCTPFSPAMEPLLVRWLALFPSLRYISFDSFTFIRMSSDDRVAFADSIGDACLLVEAVDIGYKKYLIAR